MKQRVEILHILSGLHRGHLCPEECVQQRVAAFEGRSSPENQLAVQSKLSTNSGRRSRVIALQSAAGNEARVTMLIGVGREKFQLSNFVTGQG